MPIQRGEFGIVLTYADQPYLHDIQSFCRQGCGDFWVALGENDTVVGSIALRSKSHPDIILHAAEQMGVKTTDFLFIEDNPSV